MSVAPSARKRRGHLPISYVDARRALGLSPGQFRVWAGLALSPELGKQGTVDLPRGWVLDRARTPVTRDTLKKLPGHLRTIEQAGLIRVAVEGSRVRFRVTGSPPTADELQSRRGRRWSYARLWRADLDRADDPTDPLTTALLQAWVCRWLHVLRLDRVRISQTDLANRWGIRRETVAREAAQLVDAGLLEMRRTGREMVAWDAELTAPDAPIRDLSRTPWCEDSGTGDVSQQAPRHRNTLSTARTRSTKHSALDAPVVTTRQGRYESNAGELETGTASGPGASETKQSRGAGDWALREAWRLVSKRRWLMAVPDRVRIKNVNLLAGKLRRGGVGGLDDVWTPESLGRMLDESDPGEPTTDHARIIRAGLRDLVGDEKADTCRECSAPRSDHFIGCPTLAAEVDHTYSLDEVHALAAASLAEAGSQITTGADQDQHPGTLDQLRQRVLAAAEAEPPADQEQLTDFLAGRMLLQSERTGQPVAAIAAALRVAPEHESALEIAAGTAAILADREAVSA